MTTYQPHSTSSKPRHQPPQSRWIRASIIAGMMLIGLFFIVGLARTSQSAVDNLVRQAKTKQGSEREKHLKTLAVTTGNNDAVQVALADYYTEINQPEAAGDAYAAGSNKLTDEAMASYIIAGEYTRAQQLFKAQPNKKQGSEVRAQAAIAAYNLNDIETGCSYAQQAQSVDAQEACQILRQSDITRTDAYRLATLRVYTKAKTVIESAANKTAGDYLLLVGIESQQGRLEQAADLYVAALKQFPTDRTLAEQGMAYCKQSRGVKGCGSVTPLAEAILKQTQFVK
ncbi:MAG: hypothetical protein U0526_03100 [Candidatus Saccharibacteria bacterium]